MAARARGIGGDLRHEADRLTPSVSESSDTVLVIDVPVGHTERIGMAEVDLVLALAAFSLRRVDRDLHRVHRAAHVADESVVVPGDQDVVIGVQMIGRRGKAAVPCARFGEGVPEQIEPVSSGIQGKARGRRPT